MTLVIKYVNYGDEHRMFARLFEVPDEILPITSEVPSSLEVYEAASKKHEITFDNLRERYPEFDSHQIWGWSLMRAVQTLQQGFITLKADGHGYPIKRDRAVEVVRPPEDSPLDARYLHIPSRAVSALARARPDVRTLSDLLKLTPTEVNSIRGLGKRSKAFKWLMASIKDHKLALASE